VTTGLLPEVTLPAPGAKRTPGASEAYRELIELELSRGRNAMDIWQDLVDRHGFIGGYQSVQRLVRRLRGAVSPEARVIIETRPGEECQVDCGTGPMVRDADSGKYRLTRLFVLTLGYSRKSVRLLRLSSFFAHRRFEMEDQHSPAILHHVFDFRGIPQSDVNLSQYCLSVGDWHPSQPRLVGGTKSLQNPYQFMIALSHSPDPVYKLYFPDLKRKFDLTHIVTRFFRFIHRVPSQIVLAPHLARSVSACWT
jgi:hypothetical protein